MKEKKLTILLLMFLFVFSIGVFSIGNKGKVENVRSRLNKLYTIQISTNKKSYTAKDSFPIYIHTKGSYNVISTSASISLSKNKSFTKKIRTSGDQIIYVKLNAETDHTTVKLKNPWNEKTLMLSLKNGYYICKIKK